jgi:spermidine synthase
MLTRVILYGVFALSGAAGLIYETIWSRYLGLFVGHSAYAQILVLAIFLGGMSAGALLVGQRSERLRRPLQWYAAVELIVGLIALVFHEIYGTVTQFAYEAVFPRVGAGSAIIVAQWTIASLLILPQSVLLGTTFPLMSAAVLRRAPAYPGRILALLYFANSGGAAVGALLTGFYFVGMAGLPGTVLIAGMINIMVALVAYVVARLWEDEPVTFSAAIPAPAEQSERRRDLLLWRLLLLVSFATAIASFVYEIAWIRMLSLVLGSATHSFELMLSAFILGLALGSLWVHRRADRFSDSIRALGLTQWIMGFAALATLPLYAESFRWTAGLLETLQRSEQGYVAFSLARYVISLVIMLPATFCAGITLPLITRILLAAGTGERSIGWVYGVNTIGSITGAAVAGLLLLPLIGLEPLLVAGAAIDMALGTMLLASMLAQPRNRKLSYATAGGAILIIVSVLLGVRLDTLLLTSGVFRHGRLPTSDAGEVLFYRDGRTATVASVRAADGTIVVSTNGKPDGSVAPRWLKKPEPGEQRTPLLGDEAMQMLAPLLGLAHAPSATNIAIIGFGTGMSTHAALEYPGVKRVTTIEIEPAMIAGARVLYPANRRAFDDPRSRFVIADAKSHFAVERDRYDMIFSEPSNPWVSGVASLFTAEFYAHLKKYLAPNGVFAQWIHLYEIDDMLVLSVLGALHHNFSAYEIYLTNSVDMVVVAADRGSRLVPDWRGLTSPGAGSDLERVLPIAAEQLDAARLIDRAALAPLLDRWRAANSDYYPALDLGAERTRYMQTAASGFIGLASDRYDFLAAAQRRRRPFGTVTRAPVPQVARLRNLALGAWLRSPEANAGSPMLDGHPERAPALRRRNRWQQSMDTPPVDWRLWLADAVVVERDIHAGTAGVADEEFYREIEEYALSKGAPPEIHSAITFMHGLATWNFEKAAAVAEGLVAQAVRGENWLPLDLLHDGAAWAYLFAGDVEAARSVHSQLRHRTGRTLLDLRTQLLEAYLDDGHAAASPRH